jgi:hypothetical protein
MTHVWNPELEEEFEKFLDMKYPNLPDVWLVPDSRISGVCDLVKQYEHCFVVDETDLFMRLPYPRFEGLGISYHTHFPILDFYLSHKDYDYYWAIEFDVRYTGDWGSFLRSFRSFDYDFIASHIRRFSEEPHWYWWDTLHHPSKTIDRNQFVRSFNVIFRISNRALEYIHRAQLDGWRGHNEVSLPTLLLHGGYKIMDFGGDGEFTLPGLTNTAYTSHGLRNGLLNPFCTMRWRPSRGRAGFRRNKIYHPVKPRPMMEPLNDKLKYVETWTRDFIRYNVLRQA